LAWRELWAPPLLFSPHFSFSFGTLLLLGGVKVTATLTCSLALVQVFSFVRLAELYYAGSHGMDIRGPTADPNDRGKVRRPFRI